MTTVFFDLGNTRLKFAVDDPSQVQALPHGADDFVARLREALPASMDRAVLALVGPMDVRALLLEELATRAKLIVIARTVPALGRLRIAYDTPAHLGVDRFLGMLSVVGDAMPTLLVGVGTALTIDLVDGSGQHLGGRIAPSPTLMRESLHAKSAALLVDGGEWSVASPFADDTVPALASGCDGAAVALIEASLALARAQFPNVRLRLHGGGAEALMAFLAEGEMLPEGTVLRGLAQFVA